MGRVVITGAGAVSSVGNSVDEIMQSIISGRRGTGTLQSIDTEYFPTDVGGEVMQDSGAMTMSSDVDKKEVFLDLALSELFNTSGWMLDYAPSERMMIMGAGMDYFDLLGYVGSKDAIDGKWQGYSKKAYRSVESLAGKYDIGGGSLINVTACVASSQAVGLSYRLLKRSRGKKAIVTGGFDSMLNHLHYMGFYMLGALSRWEGLPDQACRPFDSKRSGLVLGEGASVFSLEQDEHVERQSVLAEITGYGSTMDAYMVTDPDPEGTAMARAAEDAIREACISAEDINCVHLHGTGTIKNELAEYRVMKRLFGDRAENIPVFSMKGQVGHLIGACGAMELLGVICSLQNQLVPVTVNFHDPDPDVPLRVITGKPLHTEINHVLKLNAAFGGQNTALVLSKYKH